MSFFINNQGTLAKIKKKLALSILSSLPWAEEEIINQLEQPLNKDHGHLALPLFPLAKVKKQNPSVLAKELAQKIKTQNLPFLKDIQPLSGFVNFYFTSSFLQTELEQLLQQKDLINCKTSDSKPWVIDFASPNVAKYMNVGHLRASVIGQALVNFCRQWGNKVTSLNHLGDWGSQFGKLLWAYKNWHKEYDFKAEPFETLVKLYVRFYQEAEKDPQKLKEATDLFKKLEQGDSELEKIWKTFIDLSLKNYEQHWHDLNIKHDMVLGESFYKDHIHGLITRLKKKNILEESDGAQVVFLEDMPPCLIVKSDGASTYAARDLCSIFYRFEKLKAAKNIYVTGADQNLHFKQIFQTLKKIDPSLSENCLHLPFGMYRFKGKGKMSTRQGQAIYLKDVIGQAVERVKKIIEERRPELENKNTIAHQVGVGAVVFNDLMNDRTKDVDFDWDKVLDFEGRSGPFVQYTHVRCLSLLKKTDSPIQKTFSQKDLSEQEINLVWLLLNFEEAFVQALKHFKPHILARYLLNLSKEFNRFYASQNVLNSPKKQDLILLVDTVRRTLHKGLTLLNIPLPPSM